MIKVELISFDVKYQLKRIEQKIWYNATHTSDEGKIDVINNSCITKRCDLKDFKIITD